MRLTILLLLVLCVAGCKDVPLLPTVTPYKMDIQQGNVVTQDMVQKLQPGMSRSQVRFLLGTPLIVDPFRVDRWDYVYLYKKGGQPAEQRRLIVIFQDDKLLRTEGDQMPPGPAPTAAAGGSGKPATGPAPAAPTTADKPAAATPATADDAGGGELVKKETQPEEKGFFGRLLEKLGF
jgi:outer membrane protein assembly factor BamE